MSSARSTTAPCPANKLPLPLGATIARVTPEARLTATGEPIGLSAGAISSAAEKRDLLAERSLVPVTAHGVLFGPFAAEPERAALPPAGAPVAAEHSLVLAGPGEYVTEPGAVAEAPGYYTWVWTIDAAAQEPAVAASLPPGYRFTSDFGIPEETHVVAAPVRPVPQLARTAVPSGGAALAALVLLLLGGGLGIVSRVTR